MQTKCCLVVVVRCISPRPPSDRERFQTSSSTDVSIFILCFRPSVFAVIIRKLGNANNEMGAFYIEQAVHLINQQGQSTLPFVKRD